MRVEFTFFVFVEGEGRDSYCVLRVIPRGVLREAVCLVYLHEPLDWVLLQGKLCTGLASVVFLEASNQSIRSVLSLSSVFQLFLEIDLEGPSSRHGSFCLWWY